MNDANMMESFLTELRAKVAGLLSDAPVRKRFREKVAAWCSRLVEFDKPDGVPIAVDIATPFGSFGSLAMIAALMKRGPQDLEEAYVLLGAIHDSGSHAGGAGQASPMEWDTEAQSISGKEDPRIPDWAKHGTWHSVIDLLRMLSPEAVQRLPAWLEKVKADWEAEKEEQVARFIVAVDDYLRSTEQRDHPGPSPSTAEEQQKLSDVAEAAGLKRAAALETIKKIGPKLARDLKTSARTELSGQVQDIVNRATPPGGGAPEVQKAWSKVKLMLQGHEAPMNHAERETEEPDTDENCFCRKGEGWMVQYEGKQAVIARYLHGMRHIAALLQRPGRAIGCDELCRALPRPSSKGTNGVTKEFWHREGVQPGTGDAGTDFQYDRQTECALGEKLKQLMADCVKAEKEGNDLLKQEIEAEIGEVRDYLQEGRDVRGNSRRVPDRTERNRKAVGKAIDRALGAIKGQHKELWKHLSQSINNPHGVAPTYTGEHGWKINL